MKKILFPFLLGIFSLSSYATHLIGGNIGYEYIGQFGSNYRYKIILTVYNNCDSTSLIPLPVATQNVGIYTQDVPNNPMGGGNKTLFTTVTLPLVDSSYVSPPTTSGCSVGGSVCIYKGVYEGTVDLPLNFNGYHLFFQNFARNNNIVNLNNPGGQGMAFHAYIPPNLVPNSSPVFADDPVPFLCVNDTVTLLNTAYDPDGDLLVFSFVEPFRGTDANNPPNPLPWTIPTVNYALGYNMLFPFGPSGYASIDGATGLTQYMSPNTGNFVVAVEIREYRNGNLIGVSRRDLQLLVINCPPNPAPNLSNTGGSGTTNYSITECDNLCFPITFTDLNGDSLTLETDGPIFDTTNVNPAATVDSLVYGDSTVTANFCWTPGCDASRPAPYLFTATATDNGCPPKSSSVVYQITVNPPDAPDTIFGNMVVCQYQTETYTVTQQSGYTYNWTVTGGTLNSGQGTNSINVTWNNVGTGTISVVGYSSCGCPSNITDTTVSILSSPTADAGNDTTICAGDTVTIGGSPTTQPGNAISWSPSGSLSNASSPNPDAFPSTTTTYVVTANNGTCTNTDTVTVNVGSSTVIVSNDTTICSGDTIQLFASGGVSYNWSPSASLNNPNISNPNAFPSTTTTYYVDVTDALGCVKSDSITVTVINPPIASVSNDTTICAGDCVTLIASGGNSYTWTPASGLNTTSNDTVSACPSSTTTYQVIVGNGCFDTTQVTVSVNPLPVVSANNDTTICAGDTAQLQASGAASYSWIPASSLNNPNISNPLAFPNSTTSYIVTGTDANACSNSDTVTVTVNPLPNVFAGNDTAICIGDTAQLQASGANSYSWTPTSSLNNPNISYPLAFPNNTSTYIVTGTDANSCSNSDTVVITVNPLPNVSISGTNYLCPGDTMQLVASGAVNYAWTPNSNISDTSISSPMVYPTSTISYIVFGTDGNNCTGSDTFNITVSQTVPTEAGNDTAICSGNSVVLGGSPTAPVNSTYLWTPATGLNDPTLANPTATPTVTTTYYVVATNDTCTGIDSVTVTVNALTTLNAGQDTSICIGDTAQLQASGALTYSWVPSSTLSNSSIANPQAFPLSTTDYIVSAIDSNGCSNSDTVRVIVNPLPNVFAGNDTAICIGDTAQLQASGANSYSWMPASSLNNPNISNPLAFPNSTTNYIVTGTDANACSNSDTVVVTVNALPNVFAGNDTAICIGDTAQLQASGANSYSWTPTSSLNNPNISNPLAFPNNTTTYIVTGSDANACSTSDTVMVTVNPLPNVFAGNDTAICIGDTAQLQASGATSYSWMPTSSLNNPNISNPLAFPNSTTNYIVTGTDANAC
ncbi:MAG TPA: hypothetical protein DIU39_01455, partial [Flavobacteriales bacterium]|nr:hypothetical protein [Flavobacteriales bacterium]